MLSHVTVGTNDLERARGYYDALLPVLGFVRLHHDEQYIGYSRGIGDDGRPIKPMFWVCLPFDGAPATVGNGVHIAFMADSRSDVDRFYQAGLELGGRDEGPPGLRPHYHESYYGAYFRDLDGNKLQVCCHRAEPPSGADA